MSFSAVLLTHEARNNKAGNILMEIKKSEC